MFQKILQWIREQLNKMINQTNVKQALRIDIALSASMAEALQKWSKMYQNQADWLSKDIHSLDLPAAIAGEIARAVTIEMKVDISGSERANYLSSQFEQVLKQMRERVEYGCAKGGLMIKPYPMGNNIGVDYVQADCFFPVSFDPNGNIVACVFSDQKQIGDIYYTRLEFHTMIENGCVIKNKAYRSTSRDSLGNEVSLASVEAWKDLEPEATITGIDKPLFAYFRFPLANNIDTTSPLGVSCYARAAISGTNGKCLIQQADEQWSRLLWEFESGERALYADVTAFKKDTDGKSILPTKRLYRALNGTSNIGDNPEGLFKEWTPTLRETNILNGLDAILRKIEFSCGLAYGTLSNPQTIDKTATELKIGQQRSYATITDTQKSLEDALEQLIYAMDIWATLEKLAPEGDYETVYDFDDSIIVDADAQFQQDLRLVTAGVIGKVEFRMRNFGEDEKTAKKKIAEIPVEQPTGFFNQGA
jgi:A118 family predicted phage portal protein